MKGKPLALLLLPIALLGCSLDYSTSTQTGPAAGSTPDTVLYNFTTTSMHGQKPYFRITAEKAETFDKKNLTVLTTVTFEEYDSSGSVVAKGHADSARYHTDTKNAELSGNIELYSAQEKARITTGYLAWNDAKQTLTGKSDVPVTIVKDDGSRIEAVGFEADLRTRSIRFSRDVRGTFVEKSNK